MTSSEAEKEGYYIRQRSVNLTSGELTLNDVALALFKKMRLRTDCSGNRLTSGD